MAKFYEGTPAPRPCRAVQCRDALGARSTHAHAHLPRHSSRAPLPPHSHLPLPPSRVARPSDAVRMRAPAVRCSVGVCQLVVGGLAAAERVARASQHVRLRAVARLRAQSMGSALSLHAQRGRRVGWVRRRLQPPRTADANASAWAARTRTRATAQWRRRRGCAGQSRLHRAVEAAQGSRGGCTGQSRLHRAVEAAAQGSRGVRVSSARPIWM